MRLNDIEVGQKYTVKINEQADVHAYLGGGEVDAEVIEANIQRDVDEYSTWHGIKGSPRVRSRTREGYNVDGVRVKWEKQEGYDRFTRLKTTIPAGEAVIAAKCVVEPADALNNGGYPTKKEAQEVAEDYANNGTLNDANYKPTTNYRLYKINGYWTIFGYAA
jgi:hypothetical protein